MHTINVILFLFSAAIFSGCRNPKPLDISIPQSKSQIVVSSLAIDKRSIILSAGYSLESLMKLEDTSLKNGLTKDKLLDSAMITVAEAGGQVYNLSKLSSGLYGCNSFTLVPGAEYTLTIKDYKKGNVFTACTKYTDMPGTTKVTPSFIQGSDNDTLLKLDVSVSDAHISDYYFVSYSTLAELRENSHLSMNSSLNQRFNAVTSFEPKKIQLIDGSNAVNNVKKHSFTINASAKDTMIVQVAKIDDGYYKYLSAYKRTGYLVNQLTGEPINLPTNIISGYGYFSLYQPNRYVFKLSDYK